jgi:hypothetical protein
MGAWVLINEMWYYIEYLNSGIAVNSSSVALITAWSGYHGLGFDDVVEAGAVAGAVPVFAAPVVVVEGGRVPVLLGPPDTPV